MIKFRPYQHDTHHAIKNWVSNPDNKGKAGCVVMPTGSGKSLLIASTAEMLQDSTVVLQPSIELLNQNMEKLEVLYHIKACVFSHSAGRKELGKLTFGTLPSLKNFGSKLKEMGVRNLIIDECIPFNQKIHTSKGRIRIGVLFGKAMLGEKLPQVLSYNEQGGYFEYKNILNIQHNGEKEVFQLRFSNNLKVRATANHPFLTLDGYKPLSELRVGDAIISNDTANMRIFIPNHSQEEFLLVSTIGDGSKCSKKNAPINTIRVAFRHGKEQYKYNEWKHSLVGKGNKLFKDLSNGFKQKEASYFTSRSFYVKDWKQKRENIVKNLSLKQLAILWQDDGHLSKTLNAGSLYTLCHDKELIHSLSNTLKGYGINNSVRLTKSSSTGKDCYYIGFRKADVYELSRLIAPYIHYSMSYKIHPDFHHLVGTYDWDYNYNTTEISVIKSIENLNSIVKVFNLEVEDHHNYLLCKSGTNNKNEKHILGIVTHNCDRKFAPKEFETVTTLVKDKKSGIETEVKKKKLKESMYTAFLSDFNPELVIGFTATPFRLKQTMDGAILEMITKCYPKVFDEIIHVEQISTMTNQGFWAPLTYKCYDYDDGLLRINSSGSDFTEESIEEANKALNVNRNVYVETIKLLKESPKNKILICAESVDIAIKMASVIPDSNVITGKTPKKDRKKIIEDFKQGTLRVLVNVATLTCLSMDTEILTRNKGWVKRNELSEEDLVAQFKNGQISFSEPNRIIDSVHEGDWCTVNGRLSSINVTDTHDLLVWNPKTEKFEKKKAGECVRKRIKIPTAGWCEPESIEIKQRELSKQGRFIAANSYNYRKKGLSFEESKILAEKEYNRKSQLKFKNPSELTKEECQFIGFFWGDGCCYKSKGGGNVYNLAQSTKYPKQIEWIETLLSKLNFTYSVYTNRNVSNIVLGQKCNVTNEFNTYSIAKGTGGISQSTSGLYRLLPFLNKDSFDWLWGVNKEQFFHLMEGFFYADGTHGNNRTYYGQRIANTNLNLLETLQAVGTCRGFHMTISIDKRAVINPQHLQRYHLSLRKHSTMQLTTELLSKTTSNDNRCWCVNMPEGTVITRRNGRVCIMGNCGFDAPDLTHVLIGRPTMSFPIFYQIVGRVVRLHPEGLPAIVVDFCNNVKRFGRVEDLSIINHESCGWIALMGDKVLTGVKVGSQMTLSDFLTRRKRKNKKKTCDTIFTYGEKYNKLRVDECPKWFLKWFISDDCKSTRRFKKDPELVKIVKDFLE